MHSLVELFHIRGGASDLLGLVNEHRHSGAQTRKGRLGWGHLLMPYIKLVPRWMLCMQLVQGNITNGQLCGTTIMLHFNCSYCVYIYIYITVTVTMESWHLSRTLYISFYRAVCNFTYAVWQCSPLCGTFKEDLSTRAALDVANLFTTVLKT